jgi:peroxiredoxin
VKIKYVLILSFVFLFVTCTASDTRSNAKMESAGLVKAPDFSVIDLEGNTLTSADLLGKVVLINFWATWCPPCREEIPDFIEVYKELKDSGFIIIGLAVSDRESNVRRFVKDQGINYPVAMAPDELVAAFQPGQYIPTTIIMDTEGNIRDKHVGVMDKTKIESIFNELKK